MRLPGNLRAEACRARVFTSVSHCEYVQSRTNNPEISIEVARIYKKPAAKVLGGHRQILIVNGRYEVNQAVAQRIGRAAKHFKTRGDHSVQRVKNSETEKRTTDLSRALEKSGIGYRNFAQGGEICRRAVQSRREAF
jgi:hypothetical protein